MFYCRDCRMILPSNGRSSYKHLSHDIKQLGYMRDLAEVYDYMVDDIIHMDLLKADEILNVFRLIKKNSLMRGEVK